MGKIKLGRRRMGDNLGPESPGEIEPSGQSANSWEHIWTRVQPPSTKQKWHNLGNEERHYGKIFLEQE